MISSRLTMLCMVLGKGACLGTANFISRLCSGDGTFRWACFVLFRENDKVKRKLENRTKMVISLSKLNLQ